MQGRMPFNDRLFMRGTGVGIDPLLCVRTDCGQQWTDHIPMCEACGGLRTFRTDLRLPVEVILQTALQPCISEKCSKRRADLDSSGIRYGVEGAWIYCPRQGASSTTQHEHCVGCCGTTAGVPATEASGPLEPCPGVRPTAPGSGDFSIGSRVWPGTSKLIEEMGELGQVLGKLIAVAGATDHWSGDLRKMLVEELGDVSAAVRFFVVHNMAREEVQAFHARVSAKIEKFNGWQADPKPPPPREVAQERSYTRGDRVRCARVRDGGIGVHPGVPLGALGTVLGPATVHGHIQVDWDGVGERTCDQGIVELVVADGLSVGDRVRVTSAKDMVPVGEVGTVASLSARGFPERIDVDWDRYNRLPVHPGNVERVPNAEAT